MSVETITCPNCREDIPLTAAFEEKLRLHIDAGHKAELEEQKKKVAAEVRRQVAQETEEQLGSLQAELEEKGQKLAEARARMAEVEKARRELTDAQDAFELEKTRILNEQRSKIRESAKAEAQASLRLEVEELQRQITARDEKLQSLQEAEIAVRRQQQELEAARSAFELEKARQLDEEREKIRAEARQLAGAELEVHVKDLEERLTSKDEEIKKLRSTELDLRRRQRELDEAKDAFELEKVRQLDAERERIREETRKQKDEQYRLKEAEHDKQIADLKSKLDDALRKAEAGPQQRQGEVLELAVEADLQRAFPMDEIVEVGKGVRGADVIHMVKDPLGHLCGSIIYESKRTKNWNDTWLGKLKDDQLAESADLAVLVTEVLPKGIEGFGLVENVWVTTPTYCIALAASLRHGLIETEKARQAGEGQNEKMRILMNYLSGPQFRQRIQAIVDAFNKMQDDLAKEKRSMNRLWAEREKNIDRVIVNTTGMYGDLAGIVGGALPQIESMELPYLEEESSAAEPA